VEFDYAQQLNVQIGRPEIRGQQVNPALGGNNALGKGSVMHNHIIGRFPILTRIIR